MRYKENHALKSAADFSSQDNAFSKHCELNWSQIIMKKNAVFPKYACLHLLFIGIEMYRVSHGTKCLWLMKKASFLWLLEKSQWIQRVVSLFVTEPHQAMNEGLMPIPYKTLPWFQLAKC